MNSIIILLIAILIHEIGHYLAYISFKFKPSIKLKWYGILLGEDVYRHLTPMKAYIVTAAGVLYGAVIIQYFNGNITLWLIYLLACMMDIVNMIQLTNIPKKWKDKSLLEISILQLEELKQEFIALKH
jgi:hypothetical protein